MATATEAAALRPDAPGSTRRAYSSWLRRESSKLFHHAPKSFAGSPCTSSESGGGSGVGVGVGVGDGDGSGGGSRASGHVQARYDGVGVVRTGSIQQKRGWLPHASCASSASAYPSVHAASAGAQGGCSRSASGAGSKSRRPCGGGGGLGL